MVRVHQSIDQRIATNAAFNLECVEHDVWRLIEVVPNQFI
jgi:hypothetical protein